MLHEQPLLLLLRGVVAAATATAVESTVPVEPPEPESGSLATGASHPEEQSNATGDHLV